MTIAEHIVRVCATGGDATAIDLDGETLNWAAWGSAITALDALLAAEGIGSDAVIGLLGRNRLEQLSAFVATLGTGRSLSLVNAVRPVGLIVEEVADLGLCCLLGSAADLPEPVVAVLRTLSGKGARPYRPRSPGMLIEIQTSGTTGKPKRIPVAERTFAASLQDGVRNATGEVIRKELKVQRSPTLMFGPLVHTSGTINTLMSVFEVRQRDRGPCRHGGPAAGIAGRFRGEVRRTCACHLRCDRVHGDRHQLDLGGLQELWKR